MKIDDPMTDAQRYDALEHRMVLRLILAILTGVFGAGLLTGGLLTWLMLR